MRLKKGSKEAKEYMASIRAKKKVSGSDNFESNLFDENLQETIIRIAGKLINEGLTSSTYTKAKAKQLTKNVAAPVYVRKIIDSFSPEIVKEMKVMEIDSLSGWKKGNTNLIEKGEKPLKGAKNIRVTRRKTADVFGQKGTFKSFAKIGGIELNVIGLELQNLERDINELNSFIRAEKSIIEKNRLKEILLAKKSQYKALAAYLNTIARFKR